MSERMLVTQALDERDLLVKKIGDKISKIRVVDTKKRNEAKTMTGNTTTEEFGNTARAAYQQIIDLIDRHQRLDRAIVASNAATMLQTGHGQISVAGAIALRNRLKGDGIYGTKGNFENLLTAEMEGQYRAGVQAAEIKNRAVEVSFRPPNSDACLAGQSFQRSAMLTEELSLCSTFQRVIMIISRYHPKRVENWR